MALAESHADRLLKIDAFGLGGVGVAGTPSPGESLFRSVMREPDALTIFKAMLEQGTPAARLYALCGIRLLAKKDLPACAAAINQRGGEVQTLRGCIFSNEPIARVVKQICDGTLDEPLNHPRFK